MSALTNSLKEFIDSFKEKDDAYFDEMLSLLWEDENPKSTINVIEENKKKINNHDGNTIDLLYLSPIKKEINLVIPSPPKKKKKTNEYQNIPQFSLNGRRLFDLEDSYIELKLKELQKEYLASLHLEHCMVFYYKYQISNLYDGFINKSFTTKDQQLIYTIVHGKMRELCLKKIMNNKKLTLATKLSSFKLLFPTTNLETNNLVSYNIDLDKYYLISICSLNNSYVEVPFFRMDDEYVIFAMMMDCSISAKIFLLNFLFINLTNPFFWEGIYFHASPVDFISIGKWLRNLMVCFVCSLDLCFDGEPILEEFKERTKIIDEIINQ